MGSAHPSDRDRKRLLRTLVADVTLCCDAEAKVRIGLHWRSGSTEELVVERMSRVTEWRRSPPGAIEPARRLGPTMDNATLAAELAAGFLTGAGRPFDPAAVASMRHSYGIGSPTLLEPGELTTADVADRLGVSRSTVVAWIKNGFLDARQGNANRWCIAFGPESEAACRRRVAASIHLKPVSQSQAQQPTTGGAV